MAEKKKGLQRQHVCRSWCFGLSPERDARGLGLRGSTASLSAAADQASWGGILQDWFCSCLSHLPPLLDCQDRGKRSVRGPLVLAVVGTPRASCGTALVRQKARAFTGAASAAHLFLTRPSLWPALSDPARFAAAMTLQAFQPFLARLTFISHGAVAA